MSKSMDRRTFLQVLGALGLTGCVPSLFRNENLIVNSSGSPSPFPLFSPSPAPLASAMPLATASATPSASPIITPTPKSLPSLKGLTLGASYSYPHSRYRFEKLSRDAKDVLRVMVDELGIKYVRLEAYWSWLQDSGRNVLKTDYNLEWQLEICRRAGVKVIMCLGRKVPHWPECHIPAWALGLSEEELQQAVLNFEAKLVDYYSNDTRIDKWLLNAPFEDFGVNCSPFSNQKEFTRQEIENIRAHDKLKRDIIVTESGIDGNWNRGASLGDILGVTFYGVVYANGGYKTINNKTPDDWAMWIKETGKEPWMIELQAESYGPTDNRSLSYEEFLKSMNPDLFMDYVNFVVASGFKHIYPWGVEEAIARKDEGHPEMYNILKQFYSQS